MAFIVINRDDEEMRSQMRRQMRGNSGVRRMNMRDHDSEIEQAYREGYTHGYKDAERDMEVNESMMDSRRRRSGNGRYM